MQTSSYRMRLAEDATVVVWFATQRDLVVSYSIVLLILHEERWQTVRVYDNAHGHNEMHRHTLSGGKQAAEALSPEGELRRGDATARDEILARYEKMIEGWQR